MEGPSLTVEIGADIKKLTEQLQSAKSGVENWGGEIKEWAIGIGELFAVEKIVEWGKEATGAAMKYEDSVHRLKFALHDNAEEQETLIRQAEILSATSFVSGEEIVKQESLLAAMQRTPEQISRIVTAASALNAALGTDFNTAVEALNKSLSGTGKSIDLIDPSLKGLTETELKHGDAIEKVIEKYQGFADEMTSVGTGPTKMLEKTWEEFTTHMGEMFVPATNAVLSFTNSLLAAGTTGGSIRELQGTIKDFLSGDRNKSIADSSPDKFIEEIEKAAQRANVKVEELGEQWKRLLELAEKTKNADIGGQLFGMTGKKDEPKEEKGNGDYGLGGDEKQKLGAIEKIEERLKELREDQLKAEKGELVTINDQIEALTKEEAKLKSVTSAQLALRQNSENKAGQFSDKAAGNPGGDIKGDTDMSRALKNLTADSKGAKKAMDDLAKTVENYKKKSAEASEADRARAENIRFVGKASMELGESFGAVISGQETFGHALAQFAIKIISEYARMAIAAAAAKAAQASGPSYFTVAIAAAAAGAMSALFSKLGAEDTGGGEGGSGAGAGENTAVTRADVPSRYDMNNSIVARMAGRDMVWVYDKNKNLDVTRVAQFNFRPAG